MRPDGFEGCGGSTVTTGVDVYAVLGSGLSEFCSATVNPVLAVGLILASRMPFAGFRVLRWLGALGGALWGAPAALAAPAFPEAGAALAGGIAGGILLTEIVLVVVLPALRILKIAAATAIELSRFAVYRLAVGENGLPRPRKTDP